MRKASITANFTYLLASLVFLLFASACVNHFYPSGEGQSLIIGAIVITMITGILSIRSTNHIFNTGLGLTIGVITIAFLSTPVYYTHLTLTTKEDECISRWSPYH